MGVRLGIVGATGQVGVAMRQILLERRKRAEATNQRYRFSSSDRSPLPCCWVKEYGWLVV